MQSPASVEIDGETFAYKTEPRCRVCSASSRLEVESALAKGLTYERIGCFIGAAVLSTTRATCIQTRSRRAAKLPRGMSNETA